MQIDGTAVSLLLVIGGLPGSGKSTLARSVADALGATWLRIDSIEVAAQRSGVQTAGSTVGYDVARAVAADQLRSGRPVVADAVHGVAAARRAWLQTATQCGAAVRFVEVRCSDPIEHRRRVEARRAEIDGHHLPRWDEVRAAAGEPWDEQRLVLENLSTVGAAVQQLLTWLERGGLFTR